LLTVGAATLLINPGAPEDLCMDALRALPRADVAAVRAVDAVLITHPTVRHAGGLPFLRAKLRVRAPVYATLACHRLSALALYDALLARLEVDP
ncbi:MBL fold metallo-hydrolase, partial [Escherichia coli]|nr:MBL fold metallo-hydrolase [Escherichia coli]